MVADRRHIFEINKPISTMRNQLRIIMVSKYISRPNMDLGGGGGLENSRRIISKIHGSWKKKRGQSRIIGKINESNSWFTKKIRPNSRFAEKIKAQSHFTEIPLYAPQ